MKDVPESHHGALIALEEYFDQELYFELSTTLLEYFTNPESKPYRVPIFHQFVKHIKPHILQRNYVQLSIRAKETITGQLCPAVNSFLRCLMTPVG